MANAKHNNTPLYTLELNEDEAQVLYDILTSIGGLSNTRRGISDEILSALETIGSFEDINHDIDPNHHSIRFI